MCGSHGCGRFSHTTRQFHQGFTGFTRSVHNAQPANHQYTTRGTLARVVDRHVLLISSRPSVLRFIGCALIGRNCRMFATRGKTRTLGTTTRRHPRLVLLSVVVPIVSKTRAYHTVHRSPRLHSAVIIFLSTLNRRRRRLTNFNIKTSSCLAGPVGVGLLIDHIRTVLGHVSTKGTPTPTRRNITVSHRHCAIAHSNHRVDLPHGRFTLLSLLCSSPNGLFSHRRVCTQV